MPRAGKSTAQAKATEENLLKNIQRLQIEKGNAYVSDLAEVTGIGLTTAYLGIGRLAEQGLVYPLETNRGGRKSNKQPVILTSAGEKVAREIFNRHQTIQQWLIRLGTPKDEADAEACYLEHGITERTMDLLKKHVEMANRIRGEYAKAPAVMKEVAQMMQRMEHERKSSELTVGEEMQIAVEQAGGMEGIKVKSELVEQAGGEQKLAGILNLVEELGGYEHLYEKQKDIELLMQLSKRSGGAHALKKTLDTLDEVADLGGVVHFRQLVEIEKKAEGVKTLHQLVELQKEAGGLKSLKQAAELSKIVGGAETLKKLEALTKRFGSCEKMIEFTQSAYKLMKSIDE